MGGHEINFPASATLNAIRDNLIRSHVSGNDSAIATSAETGTIILYVKADDHEMAELSMPRVYGFHFWRLNAEIAFLLANFSRHKEHKCTALYLAQVLALATSEIRAAQAHMSHAWRSLVLHLVLWRNYLGFQHSNSQRNSCRIHCAATGINLQDDPLQLGKLLLIFGKLILGI